MSPATVTHPRLAERPHVYVAPARESFAPGYRRCTRCVMDTTDPEIAFDADGVCNHCHRYDRRVREEMLPPDEAPAALRQLADEIRHAGRNREYDCVLGLSGGVDSTLVAYTAKQLGLRPLAVHLDNGWNSELAVANIERTVTKLGLDLHTHVIDWEEFRDLHRAFLLASVANSEIPTDHAIVATVYRAAARHGVRFILGGGNLATESIMPASWMYDAKDLRHLLDVHRRFGTRRLRTFPTFTLGHFAYWTFVKRIRTINVLNYQQYVKADAIALLQRELDWRPYAAKHGESLYTRWFQTYILPVKFGIDKRLAHLSSLIVSGQKTRAEVLRELEQPPCSPEQAREDTEFVLKKLGLSQREFDDILQAPIRTYRDYKSNAAVLRGMPGVVDFVKRIATRRPKKPGRA